jgi:hypothetical protein
MFGRQSQGTTARVIAADNVPVNVVLVPVCVHV